MKQRYHITPEGREHLSDADIARHRDTRRLLYNYQQAAGRLHRRPLYKDPWAFIVLVIIVLLAILVADAVEEERTPGSAPVEQSAP